MEQKLILQSIKSLEINIVKITGGAKFQEKSRFFFSSATTCFIKVKSIYSESTLKALKFLLCHAFE